MSQKLQPTTLKIKRNRFEWSLKPLIVCMRIALGCNLNVKTKRTSIAVRIAVPALGFIYIIANMVVNGPCGLFSQNALYEMEKDTNNEKFVQVTPMDRENIAYITGDIIKFTLFLSSPVIHFIFMTNVLLTKKWSDLWKMLRNIQRQMKLDDVFHCKLRNHCLVAIGLLILVNYSSLDSSIQYIR